MTQEELKKLKRIDLLEMLIEQGRENEKLKKRLAEAESELESRRIAIENAGSMAQAALQLNNVFQAAEKAKEQYIENIFSRDISQIDIEEEVRNYCLDMISNAEEKRIEIENETMLRCEEIVKESKKKISDYYAELSGKTESEPETDTDTETESEPESESEE